jgi:hypothetical protein
VHGGRQVIWPRPQAEWGVSTEFALLGPAEHLLGITEQSKKSVLGIAALLGLGEHLLGITEQSKLRERAISSAGS